MKIPLVKQDWQTIYEFFQGIPYPKPGEEIPPSPPPPPEPDVPDEDLLKQNENNKLPNNQQD